jgi:pimeloyl-ACP methyl ester carboxylesterase
MLWKSVSKGALMKPLIILHGWSDNADSFKPLATLLQEKLQRPASIIDLADYITLDDEVTYDDIIAAMTYAWRENKLPTAPRSVDAIVHSTGGLVIRDWLSRRFSPDETPVDHLVMLAPANFGSPLAHKGSAFISRIINGFNSDKVFQVGTRLLKGLELASPYSWQLAMNDSFYTDDPYYDAKHILCTVLVGNTGYTGISAAANENGSDGTVRVSTANLNCALIEADFSIDPLKPTYQFYPSKNQTAFGIMDKENHRTIANKENGFQNPQTFSNIMKGLTVSRDEFHTWCEALHESNMTLQASQANNDYKHGFQNSVFFVHDQFDQHVRDYFIEFFDDKPQGWLSQFFHEQIIETSHSYSEDNSYRSIYIDCTLLHQQSIANIPSMKISLTALPQIQEHQHVGYRTFSDKDIGDITLTADQIKNVFVPNRTLLVKIKLRREQKPEVFKFTPLASK